MDNKTNPDGSNVYAEDHSIAVGNLSVGGNVQGNIHIGHTIGFTSEQVSALIKQISSTLQPKPFDGKCPYKGLDFFEEEDAELFFGREKLVDDLLSRVIESRTVFITGPSGSGKSSLVRAGLIHALKRGKVKGSDGWSYISMKPGRGPIQTLARLVAGLVMSTNAEDEINAKALTDETIFARWCEIALKDGRGKRVALFIDQFEEVFTQIAREEERVAFLNLLTHAASVEQGRVIILCAMRSDFVSNCATYPKLNAMLNRQFMQIGAMQSDELVSAIAQPALRMGLRIEPDLIAQIINDMHGEPGSLPLMQFALKDLFDFQQEKGGLIALTQNDYLQRGGIHKSLERHADKTFAGLSMDEQELARSVFSGLIEIGRGTQDTRRTANFDELVPSNTQTDQVEALISKLADARLVTTDEAAGRDTVTISHEKLIDAWPWLKKLVNENRDVIALQNQIAEDSKEWVENKKDASYLYSGARLVNANEQLKANRLILSETTHEFIRTGQARQRHGRILWISGVLIVVIALLIGILIFRDQAQKAELQATIAQAGDLAAQSVSLRDTNFQNSLLLAIESYRTDKNVRTQGALLDATNANPKLRRIITLPNGTTDIDLSPDGHTLATSNIDGVITLWDTQTGLPSGKLHSVGTVFANSLAYSPDGKILAAGGCLGTSPYNGICEKGEIVLWNTITLQPINLELPENSGHVTALVFSRDSKTLLSLNDIPLSASITLWNISEVAVSSSFINWQGAVPYSIALSPDGNFIAIGDLGGNISFWDIKKNEKTENVIIHQLAAFVSDIAISPDGKTLASSDGSIVLWETETGEREMAQLSGYANSSSIAFSPDGKLIASGNSNGTITVWNAGTHQTDGSPLTGHTGAVSTMVFSSDSKTLATLSSDMVFLWDLTLAEQQRIGEVNRKHTGTITDLAFSSDGRILIEEYDSYTLNIMNVAEGKEIGSPLSGEVLAFDPSSGRLIISKCMNTADDEFSCARQEVAQYDTTTGAILGKPYTTPKLILNAKFSPNGQIIALWGSGEIILWDLAKDEHSTIQTKDDFIGFNSDNQTIISWNGTEISFWNVMNNELIAGPIPAESFLLSPNNEILISTDANGSVTRWDTSIGEPIGEPFTGEYPWINMNFSPDSKTLALCDRTGVFLMDASTWKPYRYLDIQCTYGHTVMFSPSGEFLVIFGNPTGTFWNLETDKRNSFAAHSFIFSPDSEKFITSDFINGAITIWDTATGQTIGQPINGIYTWSLIFNPNNKTLVIGSRNEIILLDLDPKSWMEQSCERAGRNFTHDEWGKYFPNEHYPTRPEEATCPMWPLEPDPATTP